MAALEESLAAVRGEGDSKPASKSNGAGAANKAPAKKASAQEARREEVLGGLQEQEQVQAQDQGQGCLEVAKSRSAGAS